MLHCVHSNTRIHLKLIELCCNHASFFQVGKGGGRGGGGGGEWVGSGTVHFSFVSRFFSGTSRLPPPQSSPWSAPDPGWVNVGRPPPPNRVLSRRPGMSSLSITGKMVSTLGPRPGAIFFRVDEAHFEPLPSPLSVLGGARPPSYPSGDVLPLLCSVQLVPRPRPMRGQAPLTPPARHSVQPPL